jgi:hypothetical protein
MNIDRMVSGFCPLAGLSICIPTSGFMTREAVNSLQSDSTHYQQTHITLPHTLPIQKLKCFTLVSCTKIVCHFYKEDEILQQHRQTMNCMKHSTDSIAQCCIVPKGTCWHSHGGYLDITADISCGIRIYVKVSFWFCSWCQGLISKYF